MRKAAGWLLVFWAALCVACCAAAESAIVLDMEQVTIAKGKTAKLTATLNDGDNLGKPQKTVWSVGDKTIASVSAGTVTGKGAGMTEVTCTMTWKDGTTLSAKAAVDVYLPVTKVTLDSSKLTVNVGDTAALSAEIKPAEARYNTVTWSTSDPSIATVDENGVVTGVAVGKVKITATSDEPVQGKAKPKAVTCSVTVNQGAQSLTMEDSQITIAKGKSQKLVPTVSPDTTSNKKLTWTSSNTKVATVNASGQVTGKGTGSCTITAETTDGTGLKASVNVTVIQAVTGLKVSGGKSKVAVTNGETLALGVTVSPADATNKEVMWSSDNIAVATVDHATGVVTGQSVGTCKITAKTMDGSKKTAVYTVVVEPEIPLDAVTFTRSGYFGMYYEFAVTFKNVTKTRAVKYISFDLEYKYGGQTYTLYNCYTDSDRIGAGSKKKIGWWDNIGYKLSYCTNFKVYLKSVQYADGTWDYFSKDNLIGWFN